MRDEIVNRVSLTWRSPDSPNPQSALVSSPANKRAQPKAQGIDSEKGYVSCTELMSPAHWMSLADYNLPPRTFFPVAGGVAQATKSYHEQNLFSDIFDAGMSPEALN